MLVAYTVIASSDERQFKVDLSNLFYFTTAFY